MNATEGEVRPSTADTPRPTPTTQAGRDLLADIKYPPLKYGSTELRERILAIEAEARDATGLREALDTVIREAARSGRGRLDSDEWLDDDIADFLRRLDKLLAAEPQGPRWPSAAKWLTDIRVVVSAGKEQVNAGITDPLDVLTDIEHAVVGALAAVREGAERP